MPPLFPMPPPRRTVVRSTKRRAATSPPKVSQPGATPVVSLPSLAAGQHSPGYPPWQNACWRAGVPPLIAPGVAPTAPVGGLPAMTFPAIPTPLPILVGGGSGGICAGGSGGGSGFGPISLPGPRGKTSPKP
ncbi:hypothetical protein R1flu_000814 [Riccia fluitans]|uniref:Uncharacterized protein n=1 Tax=Riccia fluitans TaxID=41844 RepID=A0ABD1Y1H1_9MARC